MEVAAPVKTPVHLWIVGVISLLWNAFGAYDYVMTQTNNADYLADFSEADRAYFASFPTWVDAAWALGVWGAVLGSLLLLIRSRYAVWAFGVSLVGMVVSFFYQLGMSSMPADLQSGGMIALTVAIWVVAIALFVYAYRMQAKGVLR